VVAALDVDRRGARDRLVLDGTHASDLHAARTTRSRVLQAAQGRIVDAVVTPVPVFSPEIPSTDGVGVLGELAAAVRWG
jgi:hypothetical protein